MLDQDSLNKLNPKTVAEALARALLLRALDGDSEALRLVVSMMPKPTSSRRAQAQVKIVGGGVGVKEGKKDDER